MTETTERIGGGNGMTIRMIRYAYWYSLRHPISAERWDDGMWRLRIGFWVLTGGIIR